MGRLSLAPGARALAQAGLISPNERDHQAKAMAQTAECDAEFASKHPRERARRMTAPPKAASRDAAVPKPAEGRQSECTRRVVLNNSCSESSLHPRGPRDSGSKPTEGGPTECMRRVVLDNSCADSSLQPRSRRDSGWFHPEVVGLTAMLGVWKDQAGTVYHVTLDEGSETSCSVKTTRADGAVRVTKALIRAGPGGRKAAGRVTWGEGFVLDTNHAGNDQIRWVPLHNWGGKSFVWTRWEDIGSDKDESASTSGQDGWSWAAWQSSDATAYSDGPCGWSWSSKSHTGVAEESSHDWRRQEWSWSRRCSDSFSRPSTDSSRPGRLSLGSFATSPSWTESMDGSSEVPTSQVLVSKDIRCREPLLNPRCRPPQPSPDGSVGDSAREDQMALAREVENLRAERAAQVAALAQYHEKLQRCREVVAVTVNSVDAIYAEDELRELGDQDAAHWHNGSTRAQAKWADAVAAELIESFEDEDAPTKSVVSCRGLRRSTSSDGGA